MLATVASMESSWLVTLLQVVAALSVLALATWAHLRFWTRRLDDSAALPYDEEHRLTTSDGAIVELRRLRPAKSVAQPPLLMIHGVGFNHRNLDATPERSLPRWLADKGCDVWLLTLRSGLPEAVSDPRITFQAMVEHDVPFALREVTARTGCRSVDCLGFSMGGMLLYAALGDLDVRAMVRRVVIMGSPAWISSPTMIDAALRWVLPLAWVPRLHMRLWARLVAFVADHTKTPIHRIPYNPDNVTQTSVAGMLVCGVQDIPRRLNQDFAGWAWTDHVLRVRGVAVLDDLYDLNIPVIFFSGAADRLASPRAVRRGFEAWGRDVLTASSKRWIELAVAHGATADYGHGDMILGDNAFEEVYEPMFEFLAQRDDTEEVDAHAG